MRHWPLCLALLLVAPVAAAREDEPVSIGYEREAGLASVCPDREKFVALLRAARPGLVLAAPGTPARAFAVHVRRDGATLAAELAVVELDGSTNARTVREASCPALVAAVAVVTAIAMDEQPPAAPAMTEEPAPPPTEPPPPSRPRHPRVAPPSVPLRTFAAVGLGTELTLGSLPRAVMGYRAYGEVERPAGSWLVGGRLSFAFASAQLPDTQKLDIFVQIWSARGEACAGRPIARGLVVEGCAGPTLGVYHSYSTHSLGARDDARAWLTLDVGARLRWHPAGSATFAEIYGVAAYAATAYTTVARDGSGAEHDVPRGIGEIGIGVGRSFYFP